MLCPVLLTVTLLPRMLNPVIAPMFAIGSELFPPLTANGSSTVCKPINVAGSTGGKLTILTVDSTLIGSNLLVILLLASTVGVMPFM